MLQAVHADAGVYRVTHAEALATIQGITLINNLVINNNGKIIAGMSSLDLGNYDQMLDETDSGNTTPSRDEGPGVIRFSPESSNSNKGRGNKGGPFNNNSIPDFLKQRWIVSNYKTGRRILLKYSEFA